MENIKRGRIKASVLNIRKGPSTSYKVITKGYKSEEVEIIETSKKWHKVKLSSGAIGWASGHYIDIISIKKGRITANTLNVRKGSSTSYQVVTKVYKGQVVEIIESSNKWYKIKLPSGVIGWASGYYIDILNEDKNRPSNNNQNNNVKISTQVDNIIKLTKQQLGKPYKWADEGPNSFDCSGLVYYVYMRNGIDLPRVSRNQYKSGTHVAFKNIQPGDLLFYSTNRSGRVSHVGIYIGDGKMIHAPGKGRVVKFSNINSSYWNSVYVGAKRVV